MTASRMIPILSLLLAMPLTSPALERISLLPSEAQTYVRVSNTTNFLNRLKLSSLGKLWVDQEFQDFLGRPDPGIWQELVFKSESDIENELLAEQLRMLKGELILAFDIATEKPFIIAAMSRDDFLRSLLMDEKLINLTDQSFEVVRSTFQDVEIIQHIEHGGTPDETSSWQTHVGTTFVMGDSREWVEKCIVQLRKEAVQEPEGHPGCDLNLPLSGLIRAFIEESQNNSRDAAERVSTELLFDALGLLGVNNYSLKIELRENELVADSNLRASDLDRGIFTLLEVQPSELPVVGFIPENVASIEVGRFNLLRFWQEIPNFFTTALPAVKPQFDMIVALLQQQAGINFEQDLLAHVSTEYVSFSMAEGDAQTSMLAIELKDGAAFKTGLETIMAAPALQPRLTAGIEIETFLDHTLYTVKSDPPADPVAFCVMENYLLYGHPDSVRQIIRTASSGEAIGSLERSPLVKGLRQHVPPRAFGFGAVDWKKYMAVMVRELGKPEYFTLVQKKWARSGSPVPPPDFSKLPSSDHIASFFNVSYQYAEATVDGIHQRFILKY